MSHIEPVNFEPAKPQKSAAVRTHSFLLKSTLFSVLLILVFITWFLLSSKSVRITTQAETATVTIHAPLKLALAERYLLREGEYAIEIRAAGYQTLNKTLPVGEQQNQTFNYTLLPLPGHLNIDVDVTPAKIFMDDIEQGISPMTLERLEAGTHRIRIEAERYFPHEQVVEIEGKDKTQNLNIALKPAWADITFATDPTTARILIADTFLANTPSTIELREGKHNVRIKKSGFKDWQKKIHVTAGENTAFTDIKLEPAAATLFVESNPAGANVIVNGNYVGKTPLETAIDPGQTATVRLYKQGFLARINKVKIDAGHSKKLHITMSPELVEVEFQIKPTDARIYINDKPVQLSGSTLALPATQQNISIRKDGYVDYNTSITPISGIEQRVNATLKSLRQQKLENIKPVITSKAGQKLKLFYPYAVTMGASRREPGRRANETQQKIELKRPFYLGINEVTNAEFRLFKSDHDTGSSQGHSLNHDKQPVANVDWEDAAKFCNWLSQQESLQPFYKIIDNKVSVFDPTADGYRLPTEAEWAWAARSINAADALLKFPWGNTQRDKMPPGKNSGNYADSSAADFLGNTIADFNDGFAVAAPVGSFDPNQKGLYDMGGNVAEWVNDYYAVKASSRNTSIDPMGSAKGTFHVVRGSSWAHGTITELRLSFRDYADKPREDLGFRVARYLE